MNENNRETATICVLVNNNHCYLIEGQVALSVSKGKYDISGSLYKDVREIPPNLIGVNYLFKYIEDIDFKEKVDLVFAECTFPELLKHCRENTGKELTQIDKQREMVVVNGVVYCSQKDYFARQEICEFLSKKTGLRNFDGNNQWAKIGSDLFGIYNDIELPKSYYSSRVLELIDNNSPKPLHRTLLKKRWRGSLLWL